MSEVTAEDVLTCPMGENDADATTVGDYLIKLLQGVWEEEEGFDGKRPFSNSGWQSEVFYALARANLIESTTDKYGETDYDDTAGGELVANAIPYFLTAVLGRA